MNADRPPTIDRLYDLLADRAVSPLSPAEAAELASLLAKWPHVEEDSLDLSAAAVAASLPIEPMPVGLAERITGVRPVEPVRRSVNWPAVWGWTTAAAILIAAGWFQFRPVGPTPEQKLRELAARGVTFTSKPGQPSATVVWDNARQDGVLEVRGLPANDPSKLQYQLWIVDAGRGKPDQPDPNNRVDGGVFDVRPDGTAVVPVRAALKVFEAAAFVVTEEPPGGVIVSRAGENVRAVLSPTR